MNLLPIFIFPFNLTAPNPPPKMSKLQAKNLHYDSTLPPFLARLQANKSDRNEFQAARPKKARNADDDAEDEPVYFDEETGDTLTKSEWEKRDAEEVTASGMGGDGEKRAGEEEGVKEAKEKVAVIGTSKKRKAGKVVGGDGEERDGAEKAEKKPDGKKVDKKASKKGKKVKLSFGDDE